MGGLHVFNGLRKGGEISLQALLHLLLLLVVDDFGLHESLAELLLCSAENSGDGGEFLLFGGPPQAYPLPARYFPAPQP